MSDEMQEFLKGVMGVCEANSYEQHKLWEENQKYHPDWKWEQINPGILETVGFIRKRPICISLFKVRVNGNLVLFWHATSQLVDYRKIEKWMERNIPDSARQRWVGFINRTDAGNFTNLF